MRFVAIAAIAGALLVASASPAAAHSGSGAVGPSNFLTELTDVSPAVDHVRVRILDLGDRIEIRNEGEESLLVLGYEDEPYLRIGPDGVFENTRSAATYVNVDRQAQVDLPDDIDAAAEPEWRKVSDAPEHRWHDHRVHWMGSDRPPAVEDEPHRSHQVREWEIPLRLDDQDITVSGTLTWSPGPNPLVWWSLAVTVAAAIAGIVWRWRRAAVLPVIAGLVALDAVHAIGDLTADGRAGSIVVRVLAGIMYPLLAWAAGIAAIVLLARGRADAVYLASMAGLGIALLGGVADIATFSRAHVTSQWSADAVRALAAVSLGGGAVLAGTGLLFARRSII